MFLIFAAIVAALLAVLGWRMLRKRRQLRFLQQYRLDAAYRKAIWRDHPYLNDASLAQAEEALRQFFIMHWLAPRAQLQMPSRLADVLWHAFILDTRRYQQFCQRAFGHMFHHLPAQASSAGASHDRAAHMQPSWNAAMHTRRYMVGALLGGIPLLFALDAAAAIEDGWHYPPELLDQWAAAFAQASAAASSSTDTMSSPVSGSDSSHHRGDSSSAGDGSDMASSTSADSDGGSSGCSGSSCGGSSCGGGSSD
ncbi:glycine-rich domain-containing protein [Comamonas sediminis]|uniref:glycine-rich domain-containing protein n=1 Tax=Comamonas sediminis TaxID=1783360 RepID=UPI003D29A4DD